MWMQGEFTGLAHPVWSNPPGYFSPQHRRGFVEFAVGRAENPAAGHLRAADGERADHRRHAEDGHRRMRKLLEAARPSIVALWGNDGFVNHAETQHCIRLLGEEVLPAVREIGKELDLKSPFEINAPVGLGFSTDIKEPVAV